MAGQQGLLQGNQVQETDALLVLAKVLVALEQDDEHLDAEAGVDLLQLALANLVPADHAISEHVVRVCDEQPGPWQNFALDQLQAIDLQLPQLIFG